tara:strand:- start:1861 stop:2631 length:771 start_codon:yes stop_codon:yes gene_type:complete
LDFLLYIIAGATVGLAIGITGVGGGSIMTPLLLAFGFPLHIAVGTDLLYAAITKTGGVVTHAVQKSVRWDLVFLLGIGSLPASAFAIYMLDNWFEAPEHYAGIISTVLGITLILTSFAIIFRNYLTELVSQKLNFNEQRVRWATPVMGAVLGLIVTLSSVGAGAIATALLMVFYPLLRGVKVVGTDIAHAVPLTLFAGLGHLYLGNVDFLLLGSLLLGSLPAVHLGAKIGRRIPDRVLRPILASMLFSVGIKVAFF